MTQLTSQDLEKLAKLSALKLSDEEKVKLLPQLDNIIGFVGQLQECDVTIDEADLPEMKEMLTNLGLSECISQEDFLKNVSHGTERKMVELKTSTNQ